MNAIITGATKGIGRALASSLWDEGYSLAVCARSAGDLEQMARGMSPVRKGQQFLWRATDVASPHDLRSFCTWIHSHWTVADVLVNNAGIFTQGAVLTEEEGTLEHTLQVNLYSAYTLTREVMPMLLRSDGAHIFTMCSIASILAYPNGGAYTISKHALLGLTRCLRAELKPRGIKVTAVIAGATWSDSWKDADLPKSRLMQATDIAEAVMSALRMSPAAVVEEILIRPQLGDL